MQNFTIPIPKSPFIDTETGLINRDWYLFLVNLFRTASSGLVGTTTQVLHGGGAGYSAVDLAADVTGVLPGVYGGTGISNAAKTITIGGNLRTGAAFTTTPSNSVEFITVGATSVTLPTSGTLLTSASFGTMANQDSSNVTITGGNILVSTVTANAINTTTVSATTVSASTVSALSVKIGSSLRLDNQASTGGVTAAFVAGNKPGTNTAGPTKWLLVNVDGTQLTWPAWTV